LLLSNINSISVKNGIAVELNAWIDSLSPQSASKIAADRLGEKRRTVDSWRRFESPPSFRAALNIIVVSGGVVDFNGIYNPFWRALENGTAKFKWVGPVPSFKE
jgi:hypothetical protein